MIEKRTVLDQIEIRADGPIMVRWRKEIVEDGEVISFEYHRTGMQEGADWTEHMAVVNAHLVAMKAAPVAEEVTEHIAAVASANQEIRRTIAQRKGAQE